MEELPMKMKRLTCSAMILACSLVFAAAARQQNQDDIAAVPLTAVVDDLPVAIDCEASTVPLVLSKNGTYKVAVFLNGTRVVGILDTGASTIALPQSMAHDLGLYQDKKEPTVNVTLANGAKITARRCWAQTAKIGKFETRGVLVLVVEGNAQPLIGQSLLSRFSYAIDNFDRTMTISEEKSEGYK
jgi:aspartyl protease family protein